METLGSFFSASYSALVGATPEEGDLSPTVTALGDENLHTPLSAVTTEEETAPINEDWMVVTEDFSAVRTVPLSDIDVQRIRNRPRLTKLWDAADNSDLFIEQPLVSSNSGSSHSKSWSYAAAARKAVDSETDGAVSATITPTVEEISTPQYTRVGRNHTLVPRYDTTLTTQDVADWIDLCKENRITRRYLSRQQQMKSVSAPSKWPSKRRHNPRATAVK